MMTSSLEKIVLPYNFTEREYQRPIFETDKKRIVLVWSRRSGKTMTLWNHAIYRALQTPGEYHYMFPTFQQARTVVWDNWEMQACIPQELVERKNETMMYYRFKNGSKLQMVGGDNWERLRGTGPIGVTMDEYSEMKPEVWNTLYRPILMQNKGWMATGFTPKGQNHSFELYNQGLQNPDEFFVHKMKASENPYFDKEDLAKEKLTMPEAIFNQEYEVEFLASGIEVFKRVDECLWEGDMTPNPLHQYKMGVDLAKYNDWTVITPVDLMTLYVGKQERFNRIDYDIQEAKIETSFFKWNKPRMTVDATGVGTPVVDHLRAKLGRKHGVMIEPFTFTENTRMELLENLSLLFEQDKIRIPNDLQLLNELKAFRWSLRFSGKNYLNRRLVMEVPSGCHDDCFVKGTKILTNLGQVPIEKIKVGDMVLTRAGFKPVVMTRNKYKKVISRFGLTGTPDHPVITINGDKPLSEINNDDKLYIWNEKLLSIEEKNIIAIQNLKDDSIEFIFGDMIKIIHRQLRFIVKFGLIILEKLRKDLLFITKMAIQKIMNYQILEYSPKCNTTFTTLMNGQSEKLNAKIVKKNSIHSLIKKQNFVADDVGQRFGERIERVYNLQVQDQPEYFANNILVHNCVMSLALALYGIKEKVKGRYESLAAKELADFRKFEASKTGVRIFDRI